MTVLARFVTLLPRPQRVRAMVVFAMMIGGVALEALGVGLILPFVSLVARPAAIGEHRALAALYALSGASSPQFFVAGFAAVLVFVYAAKNLYIGLFSYAQHGFIYSQQSRLASRLFAVYLEKPYEYHLQRNSAVLLRNVHQEVMIAFSNVILPSALMLAEALVTGAVILVLVILEPLPTLAMGLVLSAPAFLFVRTVRSRMQRFGGIAQLERGEILKAVRQGIEGIKEIRVLGRQEYFTRAFDEHSKSLSQAMRSQASIVDLPRLFIETLAVVGMLSVALISVRRGTAVGDLIALLGLFGVASMRLMPALNRITTAISTVRGSIASFDVIYDDLRAAAARAEVEGDDDAPASPSATPVFKRSLELRGVRFKYAGAETPSLDGVDLEVRHGQSIAFVGPSGAGKTTLVDLLLGVLEPSQGEILIDGRPLAEVLGSWRSVIGYIPQPIFLADDTIRRNVAFGISDEQIDDEKVWRALEIARLRSFVEGLPEQLSSSIGDRGVRISGGQRQRVGIARALYHSPEVLVLDEATSALDNETENEFKEALAQLAEGHTVLVIAHRLTTVQECDVIFFLKDGRVAAAASYEKLIATSPDFRRMVEAGGLGALRTGTG